jgi:hypothetical protein
MVLQQLWTNFLVSIQHDTFMPAAIQSASVGAGIARWVLLRQEVAPRICWSRRNTILFELAAMHTTRITQLTVNTHIAHTSITTYGR